MGARVVEEKRICLTHPKHSHLVWGIGERARATSVARASGNRPETGKVCDILVFNARGAVGATVGGGEPLRAHFSTILSVWFPRGTQNGMAAAAAAAVARDNVQGERGVGWLQFLLSFSHVWAPPLYDSRASCHTYQASWRFISLPCATERSGIPPRGSKLMVPALSFPF